MNYFFCAVLIIEAIIAAYWGFESLMEEERPWKIKLSVFLLGVFSFMWGSGMGMVCISDNFEHANDCRAVAWFGAYGYIIVFLYLVSSMAQLPLWFKRIGKLVAFCGIPLWFFAIRPEEVEFQKTSWGTTYYFNGTVVTTLHVIYAIVLGVFALCYCFALIKRGEDKSRRVLGKNLLIVGIVFMIGIGLDTLLPIAIPGSAICQFFTFAMLLRAIMEQEDCRPLRSNVSNFIYSTLSVPVCMYDEKEQLYFSNAACDRYTGCDATHGLATVLDFAIIFDLEKSQLVEFEGQQTEIQTVCSLNKRDCIVHVDKVFNQYGDIIGYMMSVDDIADQMTLMRRMENEQQVKSAYLSNLAKEIRTPMNSIVGFTEIMLKDDVTDEQRENLENIRVASYATVETINEILDFSKAEAGKIGLVNENYDMGKFLASILPQLQIPVTQKKLEFVTEIDENLPSILEGDIARIREIIYNLIKNALRYTQEGSVTLAVKLQELAEDTATICIEVKDTGIGLNENNLDAVFSPYEQLEGAEYQGFEGAGLTLSIVKGYAEMMHGSVHVKSAFHEGSVFTVELPQHVIDATPIGRIDIDACGDGDSNIGDLAIHDVKVLVVDDNHINLKAVSSALSCYGLQVDTADSGEKAIALCRRNSYPIVFMDQMMPLMDGVDTMKWIRRMSKYYESGGQGKIVVLTAASADDMREQMIGIGFDEYLRKPVDFNILEELLVRFLPENKITRGVAGRLKQQSEDAKTQAMNMNLTVRGLDMAKGLMHCGGDKEAYYEILAMMATGCKEQLRNLEAMVNPELKDYPTAIHGVKGSCYSIGADILGDQARELEMASKAGDYEFVESHHGNFAQNYAMQMNLIYSYLCQVGYHPQVKSSDSKSVLSEIRMAAKEYDIAKISRLTENIKDCDGVDEEFRNKLLQLMDEVDLDGIVAAIDAHNNQ